jgi:hypothetical protein
MIAENIAEEEAGRSPARAPATITPAIFRFCKAAGLSEAEVRAMK